jgi:hypothetical protein
MSDKVKCSVEGVFYQNGMMGVCSHSKSGGYCGLKGECENKVEVKKIPVVGL